MKYVAVLQGQKGDVGPVGPPGPPGQPTRLPPGNNFGSGSGAEGGVRVSMAPTCLFVTFETRYVINIFTSVVIRPTYSL